MAQSPQRACATLAAQYLNTLYDGITGMPVKAGRIATENGARAMRQCIDDMRAQDMQRQRSMRDIEFTLEKVQAPAVPDTRMSVTAMERYSANYDAASPRDCELNGRREHHFVMVVDITGKLQVDDYRCEQLSERRGSIAIKNRQLQETVMKARRPHANDTPTSAPEPAEGARPSRYRRRRRLWNEGTRKLAMVVAALLLLGVLYLLYFGAHARVIEVSLYTGRERETITIMGQQILRREKATATSTWISGWLDAPGNYWVPARGWRKEFVESREAIAPPVKAQVALDTLTLVHQYSRHDSERAIDYASRFQGLVQRLVPVLQEAPEAEPWEPLRDEFLALQKQLRQELE